MLTNHQILEQLSQSEQYKGYCRNIARHDLADDLYQEFMLLLLEYDDLPRVYQKEWFSLFCIRVISNLYRNKDSVFSRKYRHIGDKIRYYQSIYSNHPDTITLPEPFTEPKDELFAKTMLCIEQELGNMDPDLAKPFRDWMHRKSVKRMAGHARTSKTTMYQTIRKVKHRLRSSPCVPCQEP